MFMPESTASQKPKNSNSLQASNKIQAKALYDYSALEADELSFKEGDLLTILESNVEGEWYKASFRGRVGLVPSNYLEILKNNQNQQRVLPQLPSSKPKEQIIIKISDNDVLNAVEAGDIKKIQQMHLTDNHLRLRDVKGNTLFMSALFFENFEMASWLLEKKPSFLEEKNKSGQTPMIYFMTLGQKKVIEWLYEYLPDAKMAAAKTTVPNLVSKNQTPNSSTEPKKIVEARKSILKKPAEKRGMTDFDILVAVEQGDLNSIQHLDINNLFKQKDNEGHTVFMHALWFEQFDVAKFLKQKKPAFLQEKNTSNLTPLIWLVCFGKLKAVQWLLANGASVDEKDAAGNSLFIVALYNEQIETAAWLLKNKAAFLHETNNQQLTPMLFIIQTGKVKSLEWLINNGVRMSAQDGEGNSMFLVALNFGQFDTAAWLLQKSPGFLSQVNKAKLSPMIYSIVNDKLEAIKWLLNNGASWDEKDFNGNSIFMVALGNNKFEIAKWLVDQNPNFLKGTDKFGNNVAQWLINQCYLDALDWLYENNYYNRIDQSNMTKPTQVSTAQISLPSNATSKTLTNAEIFNAVRSGDIESIKYIDTNHASLFQKDHNGDDLFINALWNGHFNVAALLLQKKPSFLREKDSFGHTPFMIAARYEKFDIMEWLYIQNSSFLREEFQNQLTPLTWAAGSSKTAVMLWLNNHGVGLGEKNSAGSFPLSIAICNGQIESAAWLVNKGASLKQLINNKSFLVESLLCGKNEMAEWLLKQRPEFLNDRDHLNNTVLMTLLDNNCFQGAAWILSKDKSLLRKEGNNQHTPLTFFAGRGNLEALKWLKSNGVGLMELNSKGYSAYNIACEQKKSEAMTWLEGQGAKPKSQPAAASAPQAQVYSTPAARQTMYAPPQQQRASTRVIYVNQSVPARNTFAENMNATANFLNAAARFENGLANDVNAFNNAFNP